MSKIFRMEYDTPEATIYTLPVLSAICMTYMADFIYDEIKDWI